MHAKFYHITSQAIQTPPSGNHSDNSRQGLDSGYWIKSAIYLDIGEERPIAAAVSLIGPQFLFIFIVIYSFPSQHSLETAEKSALHRKDFADNRLTLSDKQGPLKSESEEIGSAISDKDQLAGTPRPA